MKNFPSIAGALPVTTIVAACLAAWAAQGDSPAPHRLPPLKVNHSAAPRLEEGPKTVPAKSDGKPHADNSACFVCHGNYQDEPMAMRHAAENIGCTSCHGQSTAHRNDEEHRTPPDVMYAADGIDRACAECHDGHDASAKEVIACWQQKCPAKTKPSELVCTDCHGEHRLKFRSYWWDKKTRQFITPADGARIKYAPDLTKVPGSGH